MIWFFVILIIVVGLVAHFAFDAPKIKEQKNEQRQREAEYITKNNITVSVEYRYESENYTNNIDWSNSVSYRYIVDGEHKKVYIFGKIGEGIEIPFSEIIGCEVLSDSQTVGGIKRAIVGSVLAGDTGALVGVMTAKPHVMSYKIAIYKSDIQYPTEEIVLIKSKTSTKSKDYTSAVDFSQKVLASIKAIIYSNVT